MRKPSQKRFQHLPEEVKRYVPEVWSHLEEMRDLAIMKLSVQGNNYPELVPVFCHALNDSAKDVRLSAAFALSNLKNEKHTTALRNAIRREKDAEVVFTMCKAMNQKNPDDLVKPIWKIITRGRIDSRKPAHESIAGWSDYLLRLDTTQSTPAFVDFLLKHTNQILQERSAIELVERKDPATIKPLAKFLLLKKLQRRFKISIRICIDDRLL